MSDEKGKVSDKASEIAKNIWLAGVGAYGKAVEDAQGRLEKAMEPPKLFRELVKAGTALEADAREVIQSTSSARHSVEERIGRVRENFHNQRPARIEDLAALHKKVDQLSRKVDKLGKSLAAAGVGPAQRKTKLTPRKKADSTTTGRTKTARKKPAGNKGPAKSKATPRPKKPAASKRKS